MNEDQNRDDDNANDGAQAGQNGGQSSNGGNAGNAGAGNNGNGGNASGAQAGRNDADDPVKSLRRENATWRRRFGELEAERDTLREERDRLANERREATLERTFTDAAEKAGAKYPARVFKMVRDELALDDKGAVTNVDDVLKALRKDAPDLFKGAAPIDGGAGRNAKAATGMNELIRRAAGRRVE